MKGSFAGMAAAACSLAVAACAPASQSADDGSMAPDAEGTAASARQAAAQSGDRRSRQDTAVKSASACSENAALDPDTADLTKMGTFGGTALYGLPGELACSEPGANGVGECQVSARGKAIAQSSNGQRVLTGSGQSTVIWYGPGGISCVRDRVAQADG